MQKMCKSRGITYIEKSYKDITISQEIHHRVTFPKIYKNKNEATGGFTELCDFLKPTYDYEKLKELSMTSQKI